VLLSEWRVLSAGLESRPARSVSPESQQELAALIEEGTALSSEQVRLEGMLKTVIARREELIERGNHLREYLAAALRRELGASSPILLQFGVRPRGPRGPKRPGRRRAGGDAAGAETSEPAQAES